MGSEKTQFKKGHIPWNKGKKGVQTISEETRKKMSKAQKGKKHSKEHRRRNSEGQRGRKQTEKTKRKISETHRGERHPNWQGGISFEPYSVDWTETLKRSIRERDHYVCQLCSQYGNTVHHIDYDKKNCNPGNLITLCGSCNIKVNYNRKYWINYFLIIP